GARIGCTLHRVDAGIDTGPVVGIGWLPIDPARSLLWHVVNTYGPGIDLFFAMLDDVAAGRPVKLEPQDRSQRVYGSLPGADAFKTFWDKGFRLFDPREYTDIVAGFMPPGMKIPHDVAIGISEQKVGASCCCAHA
ncbi:MAG TPA: methionyl-tRNA formyltransferase, partial [Candidatus Omnitrophota bacterium]|nr:methionyl-tRNA formyltransferase [Candidatus Omnitrophota bacterium]